MPAYLTIAVGPNALEAKPVVLSRDEAVVTAVMAAIAERVLPEEPVTRQSEQGRRPPTNGDGLDDHDAPTKESDGQDQ